MDRLKRVGWLVGLCLSSAASAQVTWLEPVYDFGLMKEVEGPREGRTRFVNNGPAPVTVLEAKPTCGCTSTRIPDEPVAPGDTAAIFFTYDPAGRPGRFNKHIKVLFDSGLRQSIGIRGNVLGTDESVAQFYPVECGPFRLSEDRLLMGNVTRGKTPNVFVNAYNLSNDTVPLRVRSGNRALRVKVSATDVAPGDVATIGLFFESAGWEKPGPFEIPVEFTSRPGAPAEEKHIIKVAGTVILPDKPSGPFVKKK